MRGGRLRRLVGVLVGAVDLVPRGVYSPVPKADEIPPALLEKPSELRGIQWDLDAQLRFAETRLAPYIHELDVPIHDPGEPGRFFIDNRLYEAVDAHFAYAMVRLLRPRRIVELGSGYSTLLLASAVQANAAEGVETRLESFDPYPTGVVPEGLAGLADYRRLKAQAVPLTEFEALRDGDVLFVDTTHVVRTGGDVNAVVLRVLPSLAPGVHVHFHDVFLPYEYHRAWVEDGPWFTEQYLLQAFLALNPAYEVVLGAHALLRERRERLEALVPSLGDDQPSSFWIRRTR
jgi:methyltransferase family protein